MKILLLSPLAPCSGNATTICRIRGHFEKHGFKCKLASPKYFMDQKKFLEYIHQKGFHLILAIHAYKSGVLLTGCQLSYILILGGTDVNQCSEDPDKMAVMTEAITNAKHIVCFGSSLMEKFYEKWPHHKTETLSIIPQAVDTCPSTFNIKRFIENNFQLNDGPPINPMMTSQVRWSAKHCMYQRGGGSINHLNISQNSRICSHENQTKEGIQSHLDEPDFCLYADHIESHDSIEPSHDSKNKIDYRHRNPSNFAQNLCKTSPSDCFDIDINGHNNGSPPFLNVGSFVKDRLDQDYEDMQIPSSIRKPQISQQDTQHKVDDALFFTLVGGIRPVKDPLYLVDKFSEWARTKTVNCYLLVIGPKMDDEYFRYFAGKISSHSHVIYIPGLSLQDTHAVIRDSFAVVNTSLSEGMAISILEAMHLKSPVIVRDIPGNRNIVTHGETGLIFNTVHEFFAQADKLLDEKSEVTRLTSNAYRYVIENHCIEREEEDYIRIAQQYL